MNSRHLTLLVIALVLLALWDGTWKVIAMWKSARRNQLGWYVCLAVFNTAGLLPILYLLLSRNPRESEPT